MIPAAEQRGWPEIDSGFWDRHFDDLQQDALAELLDWQWGPVTRHFGPVDGIYLVPLPVRQAVWDLMDVQVRVLARWITLKKCLGASYTLWRLARRRLRRALL